MKLFLLGLMCLSTLNATSPDPLVCTKDVKGIIDQLFLIAESFEKDYGHPDPIAMKETLHTT